MCEIIGYYYILKKRGQNNSKKRSKDGLMGI